jgi:glycosyltransferase involved in cell wall biosynthesis
MNNLSQNPDMVVCICAYNEEKYIWRTIQAFLDQIKGIAYQIVVVDNASTDNTGKIAKELLWNKNVYYEYKKWLLNAREAGREYIKDLYPFAKILLQSDADIIPATDKLIEAHFKQYEKDSNIVWVWWYYEVENRKKAIKFYYFIENLIKWKLWKSHFEKRQFYLDQWIIPTCWSNMSYLLEYTNLVKKQTWSAFAEDFYYMTNYLNEVKKHNPEAYVKLLDEKNYWEDAKILVSNRDDSLYRLILNLINRGYNWERLKKIIETWYNSFGLELSDNR